MRSGQRGFTLVEVLVAVSILALVMVTLGQSMGATARAYTNINETHLLSGLCSTSAHSVDKTSYSLYT